MDILAGLLAIVVGLPLQQAPGQPADLLAIMEQELAYSSEHLVAPDGSKPYYIAYTITDERSVGCSATLGALVGDGESHHRRLDVDVRVGDPHIDNTHKLRDDNSFGFSFGGDSSSNVSRSVSLSDDPDAIQHALWLATDECFKAALEQYQRVQTNLKTKVEEEDKADDFSKEEPSVHDDAPVALAVDRKEWVERVRAASAVARSSPLIYGSSVTFSADAENRYMVTNEGTRLHAAGELFTVAVTAASKAEDGMDLSQSFLFNTSSEAGLPTEQQIADALSGCMRQVLALREAPLVEPYTGPAILVNRASGVFFHEIFGHRIEGHRQKDVEEGQTFTKKIGQPVLPDFISVHDDPTLAVIGKYDLRGHYGFDDEGMPARDVTLVDHGVLQTFLLSRSPVQSFVHTNGHGRRNPGNEVVARQGNLVVQSAKVEPPARLRELLLEECQRQGKPYGLFFEDITGGFTNTTRSGPQAFKVLPVVVYRVYADGRPDELVRGVDIVGTPLACFSKILCAGDDPDVFNGTCGAESGWVPVSAISPSVLVSEIEVEKRQHEQDRPPILPAPRDPPAEAADDVSTPEPGAGGGRP
jgi:predicted Zn-dependent protease